MSDVFASSYGRYQSLLARVFAPAVSLNTYARMVHLYAMFPLGLAYFIVLVVAGASGGALIWTFPGVLILILAMFLSRWAGDIEAFLVHLVSRVNFRRPPTRLEPGLTWREQLTTRLIDPSTWTGILYLLVQFPVGVGMFTAITVLATVAGATIVAPIALAFDENYTAEFWAATDTPVEGLIYVVPGLLCFLALIHFTLVASSLHGAWARVMLGSRARAERRPDEGNPPPSPEPPEPEAAREPAIAVVADGEDVPLLPEAPHPAVMPTVTAIHSDVEEVALAEPLTPRERDVLGLISLGYSNADIAETLVLSEGTVKTHVKRVLAKLGVHNRTEAALYARDHSVVYAPRAEAPGLGLRRRAP